MLRALLLIILPAILSCAALRPECRTHGGTPWFQVETRHFTVQTNLDLKNAQIAAIVLEKSLVALRQPFPGGREPPGRIEAVIFRSRSQLEDVTGRRNVEGIWFETWHGPLMAMGSANYVFGAKAKPEVLLHELTHHVSEYALARQPRWLSEGLAKYLEGAQIDRDTAHFGDIDSEELQILQTTGPLSFDSLWEWNSSDISDRLLTTRRYATSWLFVHYFYNHRREQFTRYLEALANDRPPRAVFAEAFDGVAGAKLDHEVQAYLRGGQYDTLIVPLGEFDQRLKERLLADSEVHVLLARIAGTQERRRSETKAALQLEPTSLRALTMQIFSEPDATTRTALARSIIRSHPDEAEAWHVFATEFAASSDSKDEALQALRKAHSMNPSAPRVIADLGSALFISGSYAEAIPFLRDATKLLPNRPQSAVRLAAALAETHACDEAALVLEHAKELLDEHGDLEPARKLLNQTTRAVNECKSMQ